MSEEEKRRLVSDVSAKLAAQVSSHYEDYKRELLALGYPTLEIDRSFLYSFLELKSDGTIDFTKYLASENVFCWLREANQSS